MIGHSNIAIAFLQKHIQMLIGAGSVIVLARVISPQETGIFSVGMAVTAVTHAVRDFGVGNYLIKEPEPSNEKVRTAFAISFLLAVILSIVLFALAGPTARFYAQPEVADVIWITTLGLLISPFSTVNLALLMRDHRFFDMFKVSMAGTVANAAVGVFFAWLGLGATALALGSLANSLALVVTVNLLMPRYGDWRPSLAHWRPILRFGLHSTFSGVSEQIGGRAADLIIGKTLGFNAVGILSRSGTLITMFQDLVLSSTAPVVMAAMAGEARKGLGVSAMLLTSTEYATVVAWPFFAVLAIFSHDAVLVLFGEQWLVAAPYTSIMCYAAMVAVLSSFNAVAATAKGRVDLLSHYNLLSQAIRVILIALGALSGLHAVVILLVVASTFQCVLSYVFLRRAAPVSFIEVARRIWRSLAVTIIVVAAVTPIDIFVSYPAVVRLLIVAAAATVTWAAAIVVVRHPAAVLLAGAWGAAARWAGAVLPQRFRPRLGR
jgi:O-antigen/teichoic acid export membrane protein